MASSSDRASSPSDDEPGAVTAARFPRLEVRSLRGHVLILPQDLPAPVTLVICAFRQWHQRLVDEWIAWAVAEAGVAPSPLGMAPDVRTAVVEVPVLGRRYRPVRRYIDGGMATGIGVPEVLARTLTAYTDVGSFCDKARIASTETVTAMVVRRDGTVLAKVDGPPEAATKAVVAAVLNT